MMISEEQWWRPQAAMVAAGVATAALLVVLAPTEAQAQVAAAVGGSLDTIVDKFKEATSQWESAIKKAAISLFWILAAIEFAVTALFLALAGGGFQSLAAEIVKRILVVGIFFFILDQGTSIVDAVIQSFRQLSASAGGAGFKPSDIFNAGVSIAQKLADNVSFWTDTTKSLALLIAALVIVTCFALIAAIVIVTMVEMYIVTYAGIILLGFGGSAFTKDYAVKYLTYAVSVGLKLMVMGLVVGIGQSILTSTAQGFQNKTNTEVYIVVGVAIVLLAVTKALPAMLQSIVVGSSVGSNTTLPAAVGTVAGAGAAAVGAMAGAVAVGHAAYRGGGSAGQMAGRAMGAVAGAAFDRLAGMPGSRMGSVMGNAASGLRQQNQQRQPQLNQQRSLTAPGSSGGGSPSSSAAQQASAAFASQGSAARGGRPTTPGDGGSSSGPTGSGSGSPAGGGPRPTSPGGGGSAAPAPAQAGSSSAAPTGQPAAAAVAPKPGGQASQPPAGGTPGTAPLGNASATSAGGGPSPVVAGANQIGSPAESSGAGSPAPTTSFAPVSTADTAGPTTEGLSADSADTTSSNAAARALASAGSEAVPTPSGTSPSYTLDDRSAGTAPIINQPARAATSTTEPRATEPVAPSEAARSTTYVHSVPLTTWRVPSSKPTKPTTPR
jgi:type IV secretion system protein TrbL